MISKISKFVFLNKWFIGIRKSLGSSFSCDVLLPPLHCGTDCVLLIKACSHRRRWFPCVAMLAFPPHILALYCGAFLFSVCPRWICTPVLPPSPHLFSLTAPHSLLLTLLCVLSYFSPLGVFLSMFISLTQSSKSAALQHGCRCQQSRGCFSLPLHAPQSISQLYLWAETFMHP